MRRYTCEGFGVMYLDTVLMKRISLVRGPTEHVSGSGLIVLKDLGISVVPSAGYLYIDGHCRTGRSIACPACPRSCASVVIILRTDA